ncbi:MAG TPA: TIGR03435 family protein [Bryobacteraceae bacterium]|jgi:uncharacterized protein (TIGR03435 family)
MKFRAVCADLVFLGIAFAQQGTNKPAFEVASIKQYDPNSSEQMWTGMSADGGMVRFTNISLKECIRAAYRVRDFQIQGPAWLSDTRFEITAKLPAGTKPDQFPEMLQSLLSERFKLELRRGMKEQPVYALFVGKDGPRLKLADANVGKQGPTALGADGKPRPLIGYQHLAAGILVQAPSVTLASLLPVLSRYTEQPIIDMTGLNGSYDIKLMFAPESTRNLPDAGSRGADGKVLFSEPAPSLSDALQTLGLKLERRRFPMEMLTVTHVERMPTEN